MSEREKNKIFLLVIKVIPMVMAFIFFVNNVLYCFHIYIKCFNWISCVGVLPLITYYAISYRLHFCEYHRMFLHYIVIMNIINLVYKEYNICISDAYFLMLISIITIISLFLILYFKKMRI